MLSLATRFFDRSARKAPRRPTPQTRFARRMASRKKSPGRIRFPSDFTMTNSLQETVRKKGADARQKTESRLHPIGEPLPVKAGQAAKSALSPRRRQDRRPQQQKEQDDGQGEDPPAAPHIR